MIILTMDTYNKVFYPVWTILPYRYGGFRSDYLCKTEIYNHITCKSLSDSTFRTRYHTTTRVYNYIVNGK